MNFLRVLSNDKSIQTCFKQAKQEFIFLLKSLVYIYCWPQVCIIINLILLSNSKYVAFFVYNFLVHGFTEFLLLFYWNILMGWSLAEWTYSLLWWIKDKHFKIIIIFMSFTVTVNCKIFIFIGCRSWILWFYRCIIFSLAA